jgi:hypothetical protein
MNLRMVAQRLRIPEPAAKRRTLRVLAGILWILVGMMLILRAIPWILATPLAGFVAAAIGLLVGILKSWYVFMPLAAKNVERIQALSPHREKICLFAFQAIKAYLLIAGMIALGILLRLSPIPRTILVGVYVAVGSALILASPKYLRSVS